MPAPAFTAVVFGETHKGGHYLSRPQELAPGLDNVSAMGAILKPLDEAWPEIEAAAGPEAHLMLFSLHGMTEQVDYSGSLGTQVLALALGKELESAVERPDLVRRIRNLWPDSVHRAIWRRLPARIRAARRRGGGPGS